jgi:aerobic C4-dicarboxylate transport protein
MSECRSLTNFVGNAVATIVVSKWENALDHDTLDLALSGKTGDPDDLPVRVAGPAETA